MFTKALNKLNDHLGRHPARHPALNYYKAARIFDPHQISSLSTDFSLYTVIPGMDENNRELAEELLMYSRTHIDSVWWFGMSCRPSNNNWRVDTIWIRLLH